MARKKHPFVKWSKDFEPHVPGERQVLRRMARTAGDLIRTRIDTRGLTADGAALPVVDPDGGGWFHTSSKDPRYQNMGMVYRYAKGSRRLELVEPAGYRALKRRVSGRIKRGQSLTGAMWRSLGATISARPKGVRVIKITFRGSERVGLSATKRTKSGRAAVVSIRHRDKAWLAQFRHRDGSAATGQPDFWIMQLSDSELSALTRMYLARLRLFAGR